LQIGQKRHFRFLAACAQRLVELELQVEMILDHALVAAGDENEMFDARFRRLIHDMLDQWPIDHREHFLGHGLGRRQKAGAKTGNREYGFADFHLVSFRWCWARRGVPRFVALICAAGTPARKSELGSRPRRCG